MVRSPDPWEDSSQGGVCSPSSEVGWGAGLVEQRLASGKRLRGQDSGAAGDGDKHCRMPRPSSWHARVRNDQDLDRPRWERGCSWGPWSVAGDRDSRQIRAALCVPAGDQHPRGAAGDRCKAGAAHLG